MKRLIFAIRDRQLDAFMQPWTAQSIGQANRMFSDLVNDKNSELYKHAGDYDLYIIGSFNEDGSLDQDTDQPKMVAIGANLKEPVAGQV